MTDLGLNTLTDDQLVELAQALAGELARRNPHVVDAAKAAVAAATARAVDDQDAIWTTKKWLATMVHEAFGERWALNVWRATGRDDLRVYLEQPPEGRRGRASKYCLHVTGDSKQAPGAVSWEKGSDDLDVQTVRIICRHAVDRFPDGVRIDCDRALRTHYSVPALPDDYVARIAAIEAEAERKAARAAYRNAQYAVCWAGAEALESAIVARYGASLDTAWRVRDQFTAEETASLGAARAAARAALDAVMAAYDAEHGAP